MRKSKAYVLIAVSALVVGVASCIGGDGPVLASNVDGAPPVRAPFDPNNPTASGMVLTFDDEFSRVSWSDNGPARGTLWTNHGINPGPSNGIGNISPEHLSVHDGALDITASRDASGHWTSGLLSSVNSSVQGFTQKFGYFEASIKIPAGKGAWPAWWLYSADHFTNGAPAEEIDIMENAGSDTTAWGGTIHDGTGHQNANAVQKAGIDLSRGFHRFGLLWDPALPHVTWYVDGKAVMRAPKYRRTDRARMMMTLNLAIGDFGGGGPDGSTPATMHMLVDYVRVYQFPREGPAPVPPQRASPAPGNSDPVALANALGETGSTSAAEREDRPGRKIR